MAKKLVLDSKKYYYTFLDDVFYGLGNDIVKEYNWLIADYECNYYPENVLQENMHHYLWLSADELSDMILGKGIQFIWGVLLGFPKHIKKEEILKYPLPLSHTNIVNDEIIFQNPLCEIEIISLDSSELYITSKKDSYIHCFLLRFPESRECFHLNKDGDIKKCKD